jgi:putative membrane protein
MPSWVLQRGNPDVEAPAIQAHRPNAQVPLGLLALATPVLLLTLIFCRAGQLSWLLELGPALIAYAVLAATYRRFPLSNLCYVLVFLHTLVLAYGAYYTYAETPLGNWAKETFHLSRNHYDRIGHLALGFFPVCIIKEVLLRRTPLRRGGWFTFLVLSVVLAIAAVWEFIEWGSTYVFAADVGQAFLGSQGDVWDAHWDMLLGLCGGAAGFFLLGPIHDRSMARLERA